MRVAAKMSLKQRRLYASRASAVVDARGSYHRECGVRVSQKLVSCQGRHSTGYKGTKRDKNHYSSTHANARAVVEVIMSVL